MDLPKLSLVILTMTIQGEDTQACCVQDIDKLTGSMQSLKFQIQVQSLVISFFVNSPAPP